MNQNEAAQQQRGALSSIRVLDFTQMMLGPYATQTLADFGADVIKVERPGKGEWERGLEFMGELVGQDSAAFLAMNRNKRSLTVDLKNPAVIDALLEIGESCDVIVENFRPGVMGRLGLGYEHFRTRNPKIVYASGSGWGQDTEWARQNRPGQDLLIQAASGLAYNTGKADDAPTPLGSSLCDATTAQSLTIGILTALIAREHLGIGQRVEVDLFSTAMAMQCQEISAMVNLSNGKQTSRSSAGIGGPWLDAPFGIYETIDGYVAIAMASLETIGELLSLPELAGFDPWEEREQAKKTLDVAMLTRTSAAWLELLLPAGIWAAPVLTNMEAVQEMRNADSNMIVTVEHPTAGPVELIGCPITLSETGWSQRLRPPLVGEHSYEVLTEFLGSERAALLLES